MENAENIKASQELAAEKELLERRKEVEKEFQATRDELHSARPHAPVVTGPPRQEPRLRRTRLVTATVLHRAATRVSPA